MSLPDFIINGPDKAPKTIVLAHGAGAAMDSPFMNYFGIEIGNLGHRCVRFEFPYMAQRRVDGKRRPPNRAPVLLDTWCAVIDHFGRDNLWIGGKSMGGRLASMMARQLDDQNHSVSGLVCLGYPFYPPGKPEKAAGRLEHLLGIQTATLILQGTRDTFGGLDEVSKLELPDTIQVSYLEDGDHGFKPRKKSGRTELENWHHAVDTIDTFMRSG